MALAVGCVVQVLAANARADTPAGPPNPSPPTPEASKPATSYIGAPAGYRTLTTWDLDLEGALGSTLGSSASLTGFGRARAGILAIRDANVFVLGATYEYSNLQKATFGIQAEYIDDNSGWWAQIGALLDTQPRPGGMVSFGYSLVGVELQARSYEPQGVTFAVYGKIRLPIGFIAAVAR